MSEEEDKYKEKLHVLASTCESIQRENEEIASQVVKTKRNLCKARRLRMRLLQKLDEIGDPWRGQVKGVSMKSQRSNTNHNFKLQKSSPGTSSKKSSLSLSSSTQEFSNCSSGMQDFNSLNVSSSSSLTMPMLPTMPESPTPSFSDHDLMNDSISNGL